MPHFDNLPVSLQEQLLLMLFQLYVVVALLCFVSPDHPYPIRRSAFFVRFTSLANVNVELLRKTK
jgi:hypothetical protein